MRQLVQKVGKRSGRPRLFFDSMFCKTNTTRNKFDANKRLTNFDSDFGASTFACSLEQNLFDASV
jgi:hypothetical protein